MGGAAERSYLCIDLKSFYASVECVDRGLDPFSTNLVVADVTRTDKTICLAVSPHMKALGVPGRCRVFEIPKGIEYVTAPPRMARYIEKSAEVYAVYLRWIAKEDIHVYSIDEAFFDVTGYLGMYGMSARELGECIRRDVLDTTGITATCGVGPNLYLAKVALDISAKHNPDFFGVLDERTYRETLWTHRPLTDFWRIGPGIERRLAAMGIHTMGQLACSPPEPIWDEFGVDAEIMIDHAWGVEPVTMADIKAYEPHSHSFSAGQVFGCDYTPDDACLVAKEMADSLALRLTDARRAAGGLNVWVGYGLTDDEKDALRAAGWRGRGGMPGATASRSFGFPTSSSRELRAAAAEAFRSCCDPHRMVHRLGVTATGVVDPEHDDIQLDLFHDPREAAEEDARLRAVNEIRRKFGSNAMLRGMDLLPKATARQRNEQIGGHRSGL